MFLVLMQLENTNKDIRTKARFLYKYLNFFFDISIALIMNFTFGRRESFSSFLIADFDVEPGLIT